MVEETLASGGAVDVAAVNGYTADGLRTRLDERVSGCAFDYLYDPQGNLVLRQSSGQPDGLHDIEIYDGYGSLRSDTTITSIGSQDNAAPYDPIGFGGQFGYYTDLETGLVSCTHRYYDPGTGRWLTRDPVGYAGGVNLYGFCGGNPVNGCDLEGEDPEWAQTDTFDYFSKFNYVTPSEWLHGLLHNKVTHAIKELVSLAALIPLPENTAFDCEVAARAAVEADAARVAAAEAGRVLVRAASNITNEARFVAGQWFAHFIKHRAEFPELSTSVEYLARARAIVSGRAGGFAVHVTASGDKYFYNAKSNEFAVLSGRNIIRTLFKPKAGVAYWRRQILK